MRVLVTGAAGYIGTVLVERLLKGGHQVVAMDSFRHGVPSLSALASHAGLVIERADVRRWERVGAWASGWADAVVPLAGLVGVDECKADEVAATTTNEDAILTLCKYLPPATRIVFPNTNSGYGISGEAVCTEESPLRPISLYGVTKCSAEKLIVARGNYTVFRLATVFGMSPRMRWDLMVNNFVWRAVKDRAITLFEPHFRRNFIHVQDVARAFERAIVDPDFNNQVFNLGLDDANLTKRELAELVGRVAGEFAISEGCGMKDPDKRDYFVSNEKIKNAGFRPIHSLEEGVGELVKGAKQWR